MKRINLVLFMFLCILHIIESVDVTPGDVCTDSRTKDYFCNDNVTCTGTSVIYCTGSQASQAIIIPCGGNSSLCQISENGDYCSTSCGGSSNNADFTCTGLGYYPNPFDCTSYYFCSLSSDKTQYVPTPYKCPSGNVFTPSSASYCTRRNTIISNCITVNCGTTNSSKYVQLQYGFNKQYFALCAPDSTLPTPIVYVFVCPTNSLPNIDAKPPKCSYICWRVGFFQNSLDKSKYFECFLNNNWRFESIERRCPSGSFFDTTSSQCRVELKTQGKALTNIPQLSEVDGTES